MPLNSRMSIDPRWPLHHRFVVRGTMKAIISVFRRSTDGSDAVNWDPETGGTSTGLEPLWTGAARVQQNKDWRARRRGGRADPMIQHAMRVQTPLRGTPIFLAQDVIKIIDAPYDRSLQQYTLYIRNPSISSNPFNQNLLCDLDLTYTAGPEEINGM